MPRMPTCRILAIFIILNSIETFGLMMSAHKKLSPLNGQHLRVIWPLWEGNPKGIGGPLKGGVVIDYLSSRFNFTYEMVRVTEMLLQSPKGRGLFDYLLEQRSDLLLQDVTPTSQRMKVVDLTTPWIYAYMAFLVPVPDGSDNTSNMSAIIKPFQWPVWILILVSIICIIFTLNQLQRLLGKVFDSNSVEDKNALESKKEHKIYLYVFGNLLSQGGPCSSNRLPFRVVAGVWTVGAFVLVQAYTSILFTYIMTPVSSPLIKSIYDLADKSDVNLFIRKGIILDLLLSNTSDVEVNRKLGKKLDSLPNSRCIYASDCINSITPGSRNVFLDSVNFQKDAIIGIFERTGKCSVQIADLYPLLSRSTVIATFALPKQSPYTKTVSQGILELREIGLIDHWDSWFRPVPPRCNNNIRSDYKPPKGAKKISPIPLKNLFGAFMILAVGYILSLLTFFCERIRFWLLARLGEIHRQDYSATYLAIAESIILTINSSIGELQATPDNPKIEELETDISKLTTEPLESCTLAQESPTQEPTANEGRILRALVAHELEIDGASYCSESICWSNNSSPLIEN